MVEFVQPTEAHVAELVANLRVPDQKELDASGHGDHLRAVKRSLKFSTHMATILVNGEVAAIFGLVPLSMTAGTGAPWLLGTDLVTEHRRALMREVPPYIAAMLRAYPHLKNLVHADNDFAVRWLRRAGFLLHDPKPHPVTGAPFHLFEMRADHV